MDPKPQLLTSVRFGVAPKDMASYQEGGVYEPLPVPCVRIGNRRFPWHTVVEFSLATDKAAEARTKKK